MAGTHYLIVVKAGARDIANAAARVIDKNAGTLAFSVGLSPLGTGAPTHYWCGWHLNDADAALLKSGLELSVLLGDVVFSDSFGFSSKPESAKLKSDLLGTLNLKRMRVASATMVV